VHWQVLLQPSKCAPVVTAAEVLKALAEATCAPVLAVSGNVDDAPGAAQQLPPHRVIDAAGWKLLLVHIVAPGPKQKGMVQHPVTVTQ
jgi:predicted phosphodiesterase